MLCITSTYGHAFFLSREARLLGKFFAKTALFLMGVSSKNYGFSFVPPSLRLGCQHRAHLRPSGADQIPLRRGRSEPR